MSDGATAATGERTELIGSGGLRPPRRRRRPQVIASVALLMIAAGAALVAGGGFDRSDGSGSDGTRLSTSLATVIRQSLSQTTQFNGTLGYAGSVSVLGQAPGTVTWLPDLGRVVRQGQVLFRVDGAPTVLLYGSTPTWRPLAEGALASDVTGTDVAQLNHDLVALGYVNKADVDSAWAEFNWATKSGVEKLQDHLGVDQTGRLALGDVVFLPTPARVTALQATLGGPAIGPLLQASSTAHTVTVALEADLQAAVKTDDRVMITLPDGGITPGIVTAVGRVATAPAADSGGSGGPGGSDTGPTVSVHIRPVDPAAMGSLDQALVEVSIIDRTVHDVLAVKVTALLALAGGGYAVEIVDSGGTHHVVRVTPGLFDDAAGMVQVSGPGLAAGQRVVVPGNG